MPLCNNLEKMFSAVPLPKSLYIGNDGISELPDVTTLSIGQSVVCTNIANK
jgi:hypothetical protein